VTHIGDALTIPALVGVQGKYLYLYISQLELLTGFTCLGLLLARTYAISIQNQRVLGIIGLLILSLILFETVCLCSDLDK
jgi:hypothetical protein